MASLGRWEWGKENDSPDVRRSLTGKERDNDRKVKHFESLLATDTKRPLEHWLDYLKWSESNRDPEEQFLLMERCIQACMIHCKDDTRFIQICVRYADKTSFPPDVFKFLHQHDVGTKVALFWIAWAWVAETIGDFTFCDKIYKKGISMDAVPVALLHQRQRQFQRRMSRHWLNSSKQQQELQENATESIKKPGAVKRQPFHKKSNEVVASETQYPQFEMNHRCDKTPLPNTQANAQSSSARPRPSASIPGRCITAPLINCGFNKELVAKDTDGHECCFEEHRAKDGLFTVLLHQSLNKLAVEESIENVSMETDESTIVTRQSILSRRLHYSMNSSVDEHDPRSSIFNTSTTSSNHSRFVGMSASREEETINTKFAMKELSMMFSSPAMGIGDGRRSEQLKRTRLNESQSFDGPLMEDDDKGLFNNSIVNIDTDASEKKPFLIFSEQNVVESGLDVADDIKPDMDQVRKADSLDARTATTGGNQILRSRNEGASMMVQMAKRGVRKYESNDDEFISSTKEGIGIFNDTIQATDIDKSRKGITVRKSMTIYSNENELPKKALSADKENRPRANGKGVLKEITALHEGDANDNINFDGDTATLSLFDDALHDMGIQKEASQLGRQISVKRTTESLAVHDKRNIQIFHDTEEDDDDISGAQCTHDNGEGGDTATFSVFGEAVDALNDFQETTPPSPPSGVSPLGEDLHSDDFRNFPPSDFGSILIDGAAFGDISIIDVDATRNPSSATKARMKNVTEQGSTEYKSLHESDIKESLRLLSNTSRPMADSVPFADPETDLVVTLSKKGNVMELPNQSMPRGLRKKASTQGEEIKFGSRTGIVMQELGRGAYGVVVLLNSEKEGTIAVKAQSPTDCLAWEYFVMQRLEERCTVESFPFPRPLSFVSLADGALLGMSAGSQNGMNLVDISNVYKIQEGSQVPELIVLHYTAKMLKHIETLHWHGRILHCDVKPDNWIVVASNNAYDGCTEMVEAADVMLVDFGRAIDLTSGCRDGVDPMDFKLSGDASDPDMACAAMRLNLGWSFDVDTFGICASAHMLLYGAHMEMEMDRSKRWKIRKALRRYWQKDLWSDFFDSLLNDAIASRPGSLRQRRERIENHLRTKSKDLEYLLKHQARILPRERLN